MINIVRGITLVIVFLGLISAANEKPDVEADYIIQLADTSQAKRDEAARHILELTRKNRATFGVGHIREHDSAYWYAMVKRTNMRAEVTDVVNALGLDTNQQEIGMCFGQGCFDTYRFDNSMVIQLYYKSNKPNTVYFDTIIWQPKRVYVEAPAKFTGEWITYYVNGEVSHRVQYENGVYDGVFASYHPNGQVAYTQHYASGVAEGEDRGFYFSGKLMYVGNYKNGKQEGEWVHYWENGNVKTKMNFLNGEHEGVEQDFFENGSLYTESVYKDGKQVRHRSWDKKGNCLFDTDKMK